MAKIHGLIAEFDSPSTLLKAGTAMRDKGFKQFDCHSPFPIHGMDNAMGLKRSPLGYIIAFFAIIGGLIGLGLQTWVHSIVYPLILSGKPFFAWQAYIVVTFALIILFGALGADYSVYSRDFSAVRCLNTRAPGRLCSDALPSMNCHGR